LNNPRFRYFKARTALAQKDLIGGEREIEEAIKQAEARGAEYREALNHAAWMYVEANGPEYSTYYTNKQEPQYYKEKRYRALNYAQRALEATLDDDYETQALVLGTVAMSFRLVGMHYQATLADYRGLKATIAAITDINTQASLKNPSQPSPPPPQVLIDLRTKQCDRLIQKYEEYGPQAVQLMPVDNKPKLHQIMHRAILEQVILRSYRYCPLFKKDDKVKTGLVRVGKSFQQVLDATKPGSGIDVIARFGLALNQTLQADYFNERGTNNSFENGIYVLNHISAEERMLVKDFVLTTEPRIMLKNNLAWTILKSPIIDGDQLNPDDIVALARDAANDSGWKNPDVLHTLAAALYLQATSDQPNQEALEEGLALL
jgi:hypothetical protein